MAVYYDTLIADLKGSEAELFKKLDSLAKEVNKKATTGMSDAVDEAENIRKWTQHLEEHGKLAEMFKTDFKTGLRKDQIGELFQIYGENKLTEKGKTPAWLVFLKEQTGFFSLLLWLGSFLCFLAYGISEDKTDKSNLYLGIVLGGVVFITGCFSYMQTSKAASLMEDFQNFIPQQCLVTRDGQQAKMDASQLLPGDIIEVRGGDAVPADIIIFKANEMKVNNASLTGESEDLLRVVNEKT